MSTRYEVVPFTAEHLDDAARLLVARHRDHRRAVPALDPAYERPGVARALIEELVSRDYAIGTICFAGGKAQAYLIGTRRSETWGPNVWVEDAGCAALDGEALREAYAAAAAAWVESGRTLHFANVPATDELLHDAWFSLSFGLQHIHAIRAAVGTDFEPPTTPGVTIRPLERADLPAVAVLGLVLPLHVSQSPVFSRMPLETVEEILAEAEKEFGDPRFTEFVAEHDGRIVGISVACSIEESPGNTRMMRAPRTAFLGHAAVSEDARGLGAGRALGHSVMAWARDSGFEWIAADWRSTNLEANRTWSALGFGPSFHRLHRAIV
jgi:GNAT superfamily N-acetyltransferase